MLFRRESINEDVTPGAPAMFSFSSPWKLSGALDLSGTPSRKHLPWTWVVLLALARLASCSTLALAQEILRVPGEGGYSQGAHPTFFPWETKVSIQGCLQGWSCGFSKAGRDHPRKITLPVCSWYFSTWLTLAEHPSTNIYTLHPPTQLICNPVASPKISTGF